MLQACNGESRTCLSYARSLLINKKNIHSPSMTAIHYHYLLSINQITSIPTKSSLDVNKLFLIPQPSVAKTSARSPFPSRRITHIKPRTCFKLDDSCRCILFPTLSKADEYKGALPGLFYFILFIKRYC